ncbi:MAG: NAD(P)-dependent glycerol-3-phosphate dehydrogenase [Candidatus Riflebacteria bacterium]|nr:NAD(P)-dependent glycerol-3-phosphate dehydrogenase [Candidatus Riflebacteria bacterium]
MASREFVILGAGNWGLTMACLLGRKGFSVRVWDHKMERALTTELERESREYLPGTKLPITVGVGSDLSTLMAGVATAILAVPVPAIRQTLEAHRTLFHPGMLVLSLAKGIEYETGHRASEIIEEVLGASLRDSIVVLSGPNLAPEVVRESPASAVVAGACEAACRQIQQDLATPFFRLYTSQDVVGVELGGALKNIIAIACGIVDELGLGCNTRAALMTRGLAEITRLGVAMKADPLTFVGLSGMGDLVATCTSELSRNHSVGRFVARGLSLEEARGRMRMVAEGINTTRSALKLAGSTGVPMPITEEVHAVLFEKKDPRQAIRDLMLRELKRENEYSTKGGQVQ